MLPARLPKERVQAYYRWIAPTHDWLAKLVERRARDLAIEIANVKNHEIVLETAVGTGLSFAKLVQRNPNGHTTGVDVTPEMLARARRRMKRHGFDPGCYTLTDGDAYQLGFVDNSFDLVVNGYMFDMLPVSDFCQVLNEFTRVLKPEGRLLLLYLGHPRKWYESLWNGLYCIHPFFLGGCRGISLVEAVQSTGLEILDHRFVSQLSFPSEILLCQKSRGEELRGTICID